MLKEYSVSPVNLDPEADSSQLNTETSTEHDSNDFQYLIII